MAEHEQRWTRSSEVAVVDHGSSVVLLDLENLDTARPMVLEGSAAAIWHALAVPRTAREVAEVVAVDFGLPATEVEPDVDAFLTTLSGRGLASSSPMTD